MKEKHVLSLSEQETQPINLNAVSSAYLFKKYLKEQRLSSLDVALVAKVRYLVTWNIEHGNPISPSQAVLVRKGLQQLTGKSYTAPIYTVQQCSM